MNEVEYIKMQLGETERLLALTEEALELALAALKLRRVLDGRNPTSVSEEQAVADLLEEYGDVLNSVEVIVTPTQHEQAMQSRAEKRTRWVRRLKERDTVRADDKGRKDNNMNNFESNDFALQVLAQGSFTDMQACSGGGKALYQVEACIIRLNHVALNEWLGCNSEPWRECYENDAEWETAKAEQKERLTAWEGKVKHILGLDSCAENLHISQAMSEVFAVTHIWRVCEVAPNAKESEQTNEEVTL